MKELAQLLYINTHAHDLCENYSIEDAYKQVISIAKYVEEKKATVIAEFDENKIIGFICIFPYVQYKQQCYLINALTVFPEYQRKGIASRLFIETETEIRNKNYELLYVWADAKNVQACDSKKKYVKYCISTKEKFIKMNYLL